MAGLSRFRPKGQDKIKNIIATYRTLLQDVSSDMDKDPQTWDLGNTTERLIELSRDLKSDVISALYDHEANKQD